MAEPGQPCDEQDDAERRRAVNRRRPRRRSPTGRATATTAAASSASGGRRRDRRGRAGAASRTRERERPAGRAAIGAGDAVVAGRGEPAAAGHLADEPAETEGDRQPADERPRRAGRATPPKRSSVSARPMSAAARPRSGGGGVGRGSRRAAGRAARRARRGASAVGRRPWLGRASHRRAGRPALSSPTTTTVVWVGPAAGPPAAAVAGLAGIAGSRPRGRLGAAAGPGSAAPRLPAGRAPGACLVLRPVLARVRVLLRVERPVGAARRAVPAGAAPVGLERPPSAPSYDVEPRVALLRSRAVPPASRRARRPVGRGSSVRRRPGRPTRRRAPGRSGRRASRRSLARCADPAGRRRPRRPPRPAGGRRLAVPAAPGGAFRARPAVRSPRRVAPVGVPRPSRRRRRPPCRAGVPARRAARRRPGSRGTAAAPPRPAASGWLTLASRR